MHGNAIQAHEADPAIDWLAEFEPELHEPAPPAPRPDVTPAHDLTMYPAVEPESKVHASTRLIAKLPRLATVRPDDTLFRAVVPGRTVGPDPSDALRFASIEPDPLPRVSMRGAAIGVIVLVILSTVVLAGGSALRRWGRPPAAAQGAAAVPAPPVAIQAPREPFRAATEAAAPVSAAAPVRKTSPKPEPAPKSPPPALKAPPAADNSTASAPPPAAPPLDVVTRVASASPVLTTPVTLGTPPARTPAPVREELKEPAAAAPPPVRISDSALIQSVVDRYEHAFSTLSLDGITAFWPGVNTRTLAKAFDQLQEQHLSFDACRIEVHGDEADAMCGGQARFVPKIGSRTPRFERHVWAFTLMRQQQVWVIYKVDVK